MRKPEGEEHHVIVRVGLPIEEICYHIVDVGASHPFPVEREDLRRTIHNGEIVGGASEPLGPPTSTSGQFQDRTRGSEGGESGVYDRHLTLPFEQRFLAPVEPAPSLPPFVVLRRPGLIVRPLLCE